ncbi:BUD32 family EKC/KEOPS complex subunit [Pseudazoarcus pumilus]|uniref:Toluene tolerance protein n=1 Tax=Pseudazoarcus pumilus TaxID=2067960 RepID=A0A2I6S8W9_9RHOO|nr:toluene tolerance protein [Pseudazoarcus pumilus]AUN95692.1 toluene tolerance protein [Pseudazoarcus pumilus]
MDKITLDIWQRVREGARVVEADPWGDKVLLLPDGTYVKLFRRKRLISSAAWYPYARRFADNAAALAVRGVPCPRVIDVLRIPAIERDAVHYHPLPGETLRALVRGGAMDDNENAYLRDAFNRFVRRLHDQGIYFRSLHLGNVVMTPLGELGLIDISDIRVHRGPLSRFWRMRNLRRMEAIADERDWIDRDTILRAKD